MDKLFSGLGFLSQIRILGSELLRKFEERDWRGFHFDVFD